MASREIAKKVPNCILYTDGTFAVANVRLSYAWVHQPQVQTFPDGNTGKRWKLTALLPKKTHAEAVKLIVAEMNKLIEENKLGKLPRDRKCVGDGDHEDETVENHAGHWTIRCADGKRAPKLRDIDGSPLGPDDEEIYSGCWANVMFNLWAQNKKPTEGGKRINGGLIAVKKVKDDESFSTGRISDDDVDDVFGEFEDAKPRRVDDEDDDLGLD